MKGNNNDEFGSWGIIWGQTLWDLPTRTLRCCPPVRSWGTVRVVLLPPELLMWSQSQWALCPQEAGCQTRAELQPCCHHNMEHDVPMQRSEEAWWRLLHWWASLTLGAVKRSSAIQRETVGISSCCWRQSLEPLRFLVDYPPSHSGVFIELLSLQAR